MSATKAAWWLTVVAMAAPALHAADCGLGDYYFRTFETAGTSLPTRDRLAMLERAVEVCPAWRYLQTLGEVAEAAGDPALSARAAEAYAQAYDAAATADEQARSAGRYAALLLAAGDPQTALKYVHHARNLAPGDPWLDDLAARVNERAATIEPTDIKRGLGDALFKPLVLHHENPDTVDATPGGDGSAPARSINVPIRFEVNSTSVSAETRRNLVVLAETLADPMFRGSHFVLVGHADQRGEPETNQVLSEQRADAVRATMLNLQPGLHDRLASEGRGESEPLSTGDTEADYEINRRLEVFVEADRRP